MQKHDDGSVTLPKEEFAKLNKAYQKLIGILGRMPSSLEDYCKSHQEYLNLRRWEDQLQGKEFDRSGWE